MSVIDSIPPDTQTKMTAEMDAAFRASGCSPTCHCCDRKIRVGQWFQLAHVPPKDEMLCKSCTPEMLTDLLAFKEWLRQLDAEAARAAPDHYEHESLVLMTGAECWRDYWRDGYTPKDALYEDWSNGF